MYLMLLTGMGDSDVEYLIEYMELNKIFGIEEIILYKLDDISTRALDVINYYEHTGFIRE